MKWWIGLLFLAGAVSVQAQDVEWPVIDSGNINRLGSVLHINFADSPHKIGSGWMALSGDGTRAAVLSLDGYVLIYDLVSGELIDEYQIAAPDGFPAAPLDGVFSPDSMTFYSLHYDGATYQIVAFDTETDQRRAVNFPTAGDAPLRLWAEAGDAAIWLEVAPAQPGTGAYVMRLPFDAVEEITTLLSAPENDAQAFARIGRIAAPYAVTSTEDGLVQLWQMETGELIHDAQVDAMAVFGGLNASATHFAWRDPDSTALHLLEFETETDRVIAPLEGQYIQYIMLPPAADVILGVNVGLEPVVWAWDSASGAQIDLGAYRVCERVPDMARLSRDGTTLVIGCDSGLDVWRVDP